MPEPGVLGIGTHLGGTAWWRGLLAAHPGVALRAVGHDGLDTFFEPFCARAMTGSDIAAYRDRFADRGLAGEWSDRYLYNAWMLPLLARAAPAAKLVAVLRDPVERFRAALAYRLSEDGGAQRTIHMTEAFHRGRYASQLRALERFFAPEQVLALQYERCLADPLGEYRRMLGFLGLDEGFVPAGIAGPPAEAGFSGLRRLTGRPVPVPARLWPDVEAALVTALADEAAALADRVDLRLWPAFAHLAPTGAPPPPDPVPLPPAPRLARVRESMRALIR